MDTKDEKDKEISFLKEKCQMLEAQIRMIDNDWAKKFLTQGEKLVKANHVKKLYKSLIEQILAYEDSQ